MHARILQYLDEIVRAGSIRQAAEELNVASSAISRQLLELEAALGTPLFWRMPRGLRLTAAGEILIVHIRQTLRDYERARECMRDLEGLQGGSVVIAAMNGPAEGLVPAVGLRFREKFPRVKIMVQIAHVHEIVRMVDDGDADIGLAYNLPLHHGLHVIQTFEARLGAVVAAHHQLATAPATRLSDCANYPIVAADSSVTISRIMRAAFRRANLQLTPAFETNSTAMMKAIVRDGRHVTFLSAPDLHQGGDDVALVYLPILDGGIPRHPLALIHRSSTSPGLAASLLTEELRIALGRSITASIKA
jgi:DNA-binding transcriptional LysR family regulator